MIGRQIRYASIIYQSYTVLCVLYATFRINRIAYSGERDPTLSTVVNANPPLAVSRRKKEKKRETEKIGRSVWMREIERGEAAIAEKKVSISRMYRNSNLNLWGGGIACSDGFDGGGKRKDRGIIKHGLISVGGTSYLESNVWGK